MKPWTIARKPLHGEVWRIRDGQCLLMRRRKEVLSIDILRNAIALGAEIVAKDNPKWNNVDDYDDCGLLRNDRFGGRYDCISLIGNAILITYAVEWNEEERQ